MLDFYLIQDDQPMPDYPEQANLEFAGGINLKTFENLQRYSNLKKSTEKWHRGPPQFLELQKSFLSSQTRPLSRESGCQLVSSCGEGESKTFFLGKFEIRPRKEPPFFSSGCQCMELEG